MHKFSFRTPFLILASFLSFFIVMASVILVLVGIEDKILTFINDFMNLKYFGLPESARLFMAGLNWFSIIFASHVLIRKLAWQPQKIRQKARA